MLLKHHITGGNLDKRTSNIFETGSKMNDCAFLEQKDSETVGYFFFFLKRHGSSKS